MKLSARIEKKRRAKQEPRSPIRYRRLQGRPRGLRIRKGESWWHPGRGRGRGRSRCGGRGVWKRRRPGGGGGSWPGAPGQRGWRRGHVSWGGGPLGRWWWPWCAPSWWRWPSHGREGWKGMRGEGPICGGHGRGGRCVAWWRVFRPPPPPSPLSRRAAAIASLRFPSSESRSPSVSLLRPSSHHTSLSLLHIQHLYSHNFLHFNQTPLLLFPFTVLLSILSVQQSNFYLETLPYQNISFLFQLLFHNFFFYYILI